jgi:hypothetical protein
MKIANKWRGRGAYWRNRGKNRTSLSSLFFAPCCANMLAHSLFFGSLGREKEKTFAESEKKGGRKTAEGGKEKGGKNFLWLCH